METRSLERYLGEVKGEGALPTNLKTRHVRFPTVEERMRLYRTFDSSTRPAQQESEEDEKEDEPEAGRLADGGGRGRGGLLVY